MHITERNDVKVVSMNETKKQKQLLGYDLTYSDVPIVNKSELVGKPLFILEVTAINTQYGAGYVVVARKNNGDGADLVKFFASSFITKQIDRVIQNGTKFIGTTVNIVSKVSNKTDRNFYALEAA
jgi:hypothetical protein